MNNFWKNILRYPRFFIASLLGLILVILKPFLNVSKSKRPNLKNLLIFALSIVFTIIYFILLNMVGI